MATYTTVFVCPPGQLAAGFPDWKRPRRKPIRSAFMNPGTGERSFYETREPDWPDDMLDLEVEPAVVAEVAGDYADYLEARLPPFVRSRPHWATKGLADLELRELCTVLGAAGDFESALYAPPHFGKALLELPPDLLGKLGTLGPDGRRAGAAAWAAAVSRPDHTHTASGLKLSDGWALDDALGPVEALADLAAKATGGQRLYLLIE